MIGMALHGLLTCSKVTGCWANTDRLGVTRYAKLGKNSGVRVGTKKHNIQANLGLDGVNVNALNLASASLDRKGLKGSVGDDRFFKADGSLTKEGLKASIGNKKIFNADGSLTKAGLKASVGNKKLLKGDASVGLSGVEVGADHLMGRTGVKLGKKSKSKKKGSKKRGVSVGPLSARITGGKKRKTTKKGDRRKASKKSGERLAYD